MSRHEVGAHGFRVGPALLGSTAVALAATPASAAPSHSSHISLNSQACSTYRYGQTIKIRGHVYVDGLGECGDPATTYCRPPDTAAGGVRLERQLAGSSTWTVVATQSNEAVDFSFATIARRNSTFRVT
jgi:hypothetical protein